MPAPMLQARFMHAAIYASLMLDVSEHLFPDRKFFALSADQRRIVDNETANLLVQARWRVESKGFADLFAVPQLGVEVAPPGTVLGEPLSSQAPQKPGSGGPYV